MSKKVNPSSIQFNLLPFDWCDFMVSVNSDDVKFMISKIEHVVVNGLDDHYTKSDLDLLIDTLRGVALGDEPALWKVTAGARRDARLWLMKQGSLHLDTVKTWFE
jgi:hypothetical protein